MARFGVPFTDTGRRTQRWDGYLNDQQSHHPPTHLDGPNGSHLSDQEPTGVVVYVLSCMFIFSLYLHSDVAFSPLFPGIFPIATTSCVSAQLCAFPTRMFVYSFYFLCMQGQFATTLSNLFGTMISV